MIQYAILIGDGSYAVGPFKCLDDAELYVETDPEKEGLEIIELSKPGRGWKRSAMMTQRDFELIAKVLRCNGSPLVLCVSFAEALKNTNPNFNRECFLEACKQEKLASQYNIETDKKVNAVLDASGITDGRTLNYPK